MNLKYTAPYEDYSGYGEASRNTIMAMQTAGVDLVTDLANFTKYKVKEGIPYEIATEHKNKMLFYKIKLIHLTPDLYKQHKENGKYNIGQLYWETDKLPTGWAAAANLLNEIWTADDRQKEVFKESGVKVPIFIVPQAVNVDIEPQRPFKLPNEYKFVYGSIFDWNERKNPKALLEAFYKEFKDQKDVCLLIKTNAENDDEKKAILQQARSIKDSLGFSSYPDVYICTSFLSTDQMIKFISTCNAFIFTHRGEGWGIPQVEAAALGRPVISTRLGGIHEYWNGKQYKFVDYELVTIKEDYKRYYEAGMQWAEIDPTQLRDRMRKVYEVFMNQKPRIFNLIGWFGRAYVRQNFNYEKVGQAMADRLLEIERKLP